MNKKPSIYDLEYNELQDLLVSIDEKKYRADQLWNGLYQQFWTDPDEFTTLSNDLLDKLTEHVSFFSLSPITNISSSDGQTEKVLLDLPDKGAIETVKMAYHDRNTLCISSQVGCAMGCTFCATGQMGFIRNLTSGEIIQQVIYYAKQLAAVDQKVTNIVLMGMGEPFHNYDATLEAIDRLNDPKAMNLGARRFTISTVGIIPAIKKFTNEDRQTNLAVSLHAVDNDLRSSMIPINKKYPVEQLIDACREYTKATRRRITFEWALIDGVNDTPEQAHKLGHLINNMISHVNLIPLNPTQRFPGQRSSNDQVERFRSILDEYNIPVSIRVRRGIDIQAGCGQLAINQNK